MNKTLIVYNMCPESVNFYAVPDDALTDEHVRLLTLAQNLMVNCDKPNEGTDFVTNALSSKKEYCSDDCPEEYKCCLAAYQVDDTLAAGPFTRVFYTGFAL